MPRDDIMPGGGQTILLVEDDVKILQMTSKLLSHLGYELITATSGREALDMTEAGDEYDLLLTDVVMPGPIGGFELAKRVLALRPEVGVIYVSGYTGFSNEEMGEVRAPLLQKPAPPTELADAIRSVFEK